jgi:ribosomal protein L7/L12
MDQSDHEMLRELASACQQRLASGASQETIIGFLRDRTSSKVISIRVLKMLYPLGMQEAKEIVDKSPTWRDRKEDDDDFHRTLERIQG